MKVVVLDAGTGNVRSAVRALEHVGAEVSLTADPDDVLAADGLVVPGVGAFGSVMDKLRAVRGDRLIEKRLAGGRPVLGICVGLQVMFERGNELGSFDGLGEYKGDVDLLPAKVVPHMGWSEVTAGEGSHLLRGLDGERFYFVHSYGVMSDPTAEYDTGPMEPPIVSWSEHESIPFVAAVENGPLMATQFHPEKSADAGAQLLSNWLQTF